MVSNRPISPAARPTRSAAPRPRSRDHDAGRAHRDLRGSAVPSLWVQPCGVRSPTPWPRFRRSAPLLDAPVLGKAACLQLLDRIRRKLPMAEGESAHTCAPREASRAGIDARVSLTGTGAAAREAGGGRSRNDMCRDKNAREGYRQLEPSRLPGREPISGGDGPIRPVAWKHHDLSPQAASVCSWRMQAISSLSRRRSRREARAVSSETGSMPSSTRCRARFTARWR